MRLAHTDMRVILDASALIAHFRKEVGAEEVGRFLVNDECRVLTTNWAEFLYDFEKTDENELSRLAYEKLSELNVLFIERVSLDVSELAAKLKNMTRNVSFCDCFAIAYAVKKDAKVITSDGGLDFFLQRGFPIVFFRPPLSHLR